MSCARSCALVALVARLLAAQGGVVEGTVVNRITKQPVPEAVVVLQDLANRDSSYKAVEERHRHGRAETGAVARVRGRFSE